MPNILPNFLSVERIKKKLKQLTDLKFFSIISIGEAGVTEDYVEPEDYYGIINLPLLTKSPLFNQLQHSNSILHLPNEIREEHGFLGSDYENSFTYLWRCHESSGIDNNVIIVACLSKPISDANKNLINGSKNEQSEALINKSLLSISPPINLTRVFEQLTDLIIATTQDGNIVYANRIATQLLGYEPRELVGNPISIIHPVEVSGRLEKLMIDVKNRKISKLNLPVINRYGNLISAEINIVEDYWDDTLVYIGTIKDNSRLLELESKNQELQKKIDLSVKDGKESYFEYDQLTRNLYITGVTISKQANNQKPIKWGQIIGDPERINLETKFRNLTIETPEIIAEVKLINNKYNQWVKVKGIGEDFTPEGFPLRVVGKILDITEIKIKEAEIKHREQFHNIVLTLATEIINFSYDNLDQLIDHTLSVIGEFLGVDRSYLFQFTENDTMTNTHEWCNEGVNPEKDNLQEIPCDALPWWMDKIKHYEVINLRTLDDLPPQATAERKILEPQGIKSLLVMPVVGRKLHGFMGFDSVQTFKSWQTDSIYLLTIISELLANALERITTNTELQTSQLLQRSILNNFPYLAWVKDRNLRFMAVNKTFLKHCNFEEKNVIGKTDLDIWSPELAMGYMADDRKVLETLNEVVTREPIYTSDGKKIWVETYKYPLIDANGTLIGTSGFARDITTQINYEEELINKERRFREFAQMLPEMVCETNADGIITFANNNAFKRFGFTEDDFKTGVHVTQIFEKTNISAMLENMARRMRGEITGGTEYMAQTKTGEIFPVLVYSNPIFENGEVAGLRGVMIDITEKRKADEELRNAKQIAEYANEQKTRFLANVSHEIRTPLNGVLGLTDLLLKTSLDKTQLEYAQMIQTSGQTLLDIINDILDISKIEAGEIQLEIKPFNLRAALNNLHRTFSLRAAEKKIKCQLHIDPKLPAFVEGDSLRIRQIVTNLLGNALKFTSNGSIDINCKVMNDYGSKLNILFEVADTGIGIPAEKIDLIFQPFKQADLSTTRKFGGTGLGLSIVNNLVDVMGGKITVSSKVGEGSTFGIQLVLSKTHKSNLTFDMKTKPDNETTVVTPSGPLKILVAEDYIINQRFIEALLLMQNHEVTIVENGALAYEMITKNQYDVILMDIQMPIMDGIEATQRIIDFQKQRKQKSTPIIALTASALAGDKERLMNQGFFDYLSKPINPDALGKILSKLKRF